MIIYDIYDQTDTTEVTPIGSVVENKFLGDTLDYLTFGLRDDLVRDSLSKYTYGITYGTDNYGVAKQYVNYSLDYSSLEDIGSLTFIDPTRMLDELTINGIAMTNATTQLAGFNKLIQKINARLTVEYKELNFYNNHHEILSDNVACQELILDGIHTVREVLDYYLSTWDLSVRLKINNGVLELYVVSPNHQGSEIDTEDLNYQFKVHGENFTDAIVTNAKNLVPNEEVKEKQLTIISEQIPFNTDSAYIETMSNIYETNNLFVNMDSALVSVVAGGLDANDNISYSNTYSYSNYIGVLDIVGQTKDKEEYDTLETKERIACPYYTRGSRRIEHISTLDSDRANGYMQKVTVLQRAIDFSVQTILSSIDSSTLADNSDEVKAWFKSMPIAWQNALRTDVENSGVYINYERYAEIGFKIYSLSINTSDDNLWKKVYFDLNYTTRDDFSVRVGGEGLTTIDNQANGTLDEDRFINSLECKFDRLNSSEVEISTNKNIYEVGDHTQTNFIIDKLVISHNGSNEQCYYHFQENYNAKGERVDINRELRLYSIPTDRYVKAVFEKVVNTHNADGVVVSATVVKNGSEVSGYAYIPFIKVGNQRTIRFKDNYAIRYFYTTDSVGWIGITANVSEALRYCDANGELSSMTMYLVNYQPDTINYPFTQNYTSLGSITINFYKDAFEQLEIVLKEVIIQ